MKNVKERKEKQNHYQNCDTRNSLSVQTSYSFFTEKKRKEETYIEKRHLQRFIFKKIPSVKTVELIE